MTQNTSSKYVTPTQLIRSIVAEMHDFIFLYYKNVLWQQNQHVCESITLHRELAIPTYSFISLPTMASGQITRLN